MIDERPNWTSRFSFILAAVGSAVGLGNIWRFPYIMGQNGGAVFLVVYLTLILTICFIPLIAELSVGKITKKECVGAYEQVSPKLKFFAFLNPFTGTLISSFYFIVGGWILNYIFTSLINLKVSDHSAYFNSLTQNSLCACFLTLLFLFMCIFFTSRGVKRGIEFANKVLMPVFAVLLVGLIIFSLTLPNAQAGIEYMFKPDFSKFNSQMLLSALGQALFTLSIGMGALLTYGSYIKEDKSITKSAYTIIFSDTVFALLAGIMIFPAIFSFGLEPNSGAGLVFVTLPYIFSQIPHGNIVSAAFFVLLFAAAITSGSFNLLSDFKLFNKNIFDFLDFSTSNVLMPLNTLIMCLVAGWGLKIQGSMFMQNKIFSFLFDVGLKFVVPLILVFLLYVGLK